jgi:hypothetical protein
MDKCAKHSAERQIGRKPDVVKLKKNADSHKKRYPKQVISDYCKKTRQHCFVQFTICGLCGKVTKEIDFIG